MTTRRSFGFACLAGFIACVWLANFAISHWGDVAFPGGPHTVTLLGLTAPSGVLVVGFSFSLRDGAQWALGKWWVAGGIVVGALLSALTADASIALASGLAFFIAEACDFGVYTPLAERGRWAWGVALSNTVGSLVDSVVFLWVAFGWASLGDFLKGQFILKALITLPVLLAMAPWRLRSGRAAVTA